MTDVTRRRAEKLRPKIEELLSQNLPVAKIASILGVNPRTARLYMFVLDLEPTAKPGGAKTLWTEESKDRLRELVDARWSGCQIAKEMGISPSAVYQKVHSMGLCLQKRSGLADHVEEMLEMRRDRKMTLQEIADHYGCTRERIRQVIEANYPGLKVDVRADNRLVDKVDNTCAKCGTVFKTLPGSRRTYCSTECFRVARKGQEWTRDRAELIMGMRRSGYTWKSIAMQLGYPEDKVQNFRTGLQRWAPILMNTKEINQILPKREKK